MTKLYYKNPLAAVYMAREFGVVFEDEKIKKTMRLKECHGAGKQGQLKEYIESRKITIKKLLKWAVGDVERVIYTHPDSHDIFQPRSKDIVSQYGKICLVEDVDAPLNYNLYDRIKIIQRNNKPFFTPEEEHD